MDFLFRTRDTCKSVKAKKIDRKPDYRRSMQVMGVKWIFFFSKLLLPRDILWTR